MSFTAALHTYFAVSSIDSVTVEGLSGVTYTDSLAGGAKVVQEGPVVFDREVDRIYLAAPDAAMKVRCQLAQAGGSACSSTPHSHSFVSTRNSSILGSTVGAGAGDEATRLQE